MPAYKVVNEYYDEEQEPDEDEYIVFAINEQMARNVGRDIFLKEFPNQHLVRTYASRIDVYNSDGELIK